MIFDINGSESTQFCSSASKLKALKESIDKDLAKSKKWTKEIQMVQFNRASEVELVTINLENFEPRSVMTFWVKSSPLSKKYFFILSLVHILLVQFFIGTVKWEIREMAEIPRALLAWALTQLDGDYDQLAQRLVSIAANTGVPIHLLNLFADLGINPKNLQRYGLPLNAWRSVVEDVRADSVLRFASLNIIDSINEDSSEATLRSLVWDPLLAGLLLEPTRILRRFAAISEWNTKWTFPQSTDRHVDWTAIVRTLDIPVLFVEIGKDRVLPGLAHKDFTKLTCLMSQACLRLCVAMRNQKRDPKVVRVFGLWVGHSQFQLCVAHPVFLKNQNENRIDLSVHLSFPEHWRFDLIEGGEQLNCRNRCCNHPANFGGLIEADKRLTLPVVSRLLPEKKIANIVQDFDLSAGPTSHAAHTDEVLALNHFANLRFS